MSTETGGIRSGAAPLRVASRYHEGEVVAARYRLEEILRADDLCEVWRASRADVRADIEVAIKILRRPASFEDHAAFEERAAAIADAVLQLAHPNLERVLDFGLTDHADPWLCCEHLEGETLLELLDREGPMSARRAAQILLPVIEALQAAHGAGVTHGDLTADRIKLVTRAHAPPSPRLCDLGVVVAEVGTDELFDVGSISSVAARMVSAERETSERGAESDDAFDSIIARGLDADPAQRWQSARDLGKALAIWLVGHDVDEDVNGVSLYGRWFSQPHAPVGAALVTDAWPDERSSAPASMAPLALDPVDAPVEIPRRRLGGWAAALGGVALLAVGALLLRDVILEVPNSARLVDPEIADRVPARSPLVESPSAEPTVAPPAIDAPAVVPPYEEQTMLDDATPPAPPATSLSAAASAAAAPGPRAARPTSRPAALSTVPDVVGPPRAPARGATDGRTPAPAAKPTTQAEPEPTGGRAIEPDIPFHGEPFAPPAPPAAPPLEHAPGQI